MKASSSLAIFLITFNLIGLIAPAAVITAQDEPPIAGVAECYFCDNCAKSEQLSIQKCTDLVQLEGENVTPACFKFEMTNTDNVTTVTHGCLSSDDSITSGCSTMNTFQSNVKCEICKSELCNVRQADKGAQTCLKCEGQDCNEGANVETEECNVTFGDPEVEAACISAIETDGNVTMKCIKATGVENIGQQAWCTMVNFRNGVCDICHTDSCNAIKELPSAPTVAPSPTTTTTTTTTTTPTNKPVTTTTENSSGSPGGDDPCTPDEPTTPTAKPDSAATAFVSLFALLTTVTFVLIA